MGTEVLFPQDVFASRRLGPAPSTAFATGSFARRRQATGPNPRLHRRSRNSGGRDGVGNNNLMIGQVTILRSGGSLDSEKPRMQRRRRGSKAAGGAVLSSEAGGVLMVFGRGRLGPEPAAASRQMRVADVVVGAKAGWAETYAGSAFSQSPSPRALPLPTFSSRKAVEGGRGAVDLSATADLRRLLRLD